MEKTPLSPAEAARYVASEWHLEVSAATVRRWVQRGSLPATHTESGRLFIDLADLHAIFDAAPETSAND